MQDEIDKALYGQVVPHGAGLSAGIPKSPATDISESFDDERPRQDEAVYRQYSTGLYDPDMRQPS